MKYSMSARAAEAVWGERQTKPLITFLFIDPGHRFNFLAVGGACSGYRASLVNKKPISSTLVLRRFKQFAKRVTAMLLQGG